MAPGFRVDLLWEKHGWWIAEEEPLKPILWVTEFPFHLGMRASSLGKRFGEIQAITNRPNDLVYISCVPDHGVVQVKHSLSKKLLLAPVPGNLIQNPGQVKLLKSLQQFWEGISSPVRIARHENVKASLLLPPESVARMRRIMSEHIRYAALREADPTPIQPHVVPEEPEETEEIYRVLARPTQLDWQPREERRTCEDHRLTTASRLATSAIPPLVRERPSKKPRCNESDIASDSAGGPSRLRRTRRSPRPGSRIRRSGLIASTSHRRASASTLEGSITLPSRTPEEEEFHDLPNDPEEDVQEESEIPFEVPTSQRFKAPVPTEEEIARGSIWGTIMFPAHIDRLVSVVNPETNHRVLSQKRLQDVYKRLRDPQLKSQVSKLVLRPIKYIMYTRNDDGTQEQHEVFLPEVGAARAFEQAFLAHGDRHLAGIDASRRIWLTEQIIWEPVDGQHIVAACKLAQEERKNGNLSEAEYIETFERRDAMFVVYDDRRFYIAKSMRINASEWERQHYSTVEEDLMKLRQLWILYGRPNTLVRADDARRTVAMVCAASAVHRLHKMTAGDLTTRKLAKNMHDLIRHAWNPSDECFEAIIRVCKDYEAGFLFYSNDDEDKWKEYAQKKKLDSNVDVRPQRKLMACNWLRPLTLIPDVHYLPLVQSCAAKPIGEDGRRPCQRYYFNGVKDTIPEPNTIKGAVDRYRRREAVMNVIRWLMVENKECSPSSMDDFFRIQIHKYFAGHSKKISEFGELLDAPTITAWTAPVRAKVSKLADIGHLIPPFIKSYYINVGTGGLGYSGPSMDVGAPSTTTWEWQMHVQTPGQNNTQHLLLIRCRRGIFRADHIQLDKSCLWVIDCRRGGGRHGNGPWGDEQFSRAFAQLALWMTNIARWNVIFLLPPAVYANEELFTKLKLPEGCSMLRGCWAFDTDSVNPYSNDFTENGRLQQTVQPIGDIVICMQHPVGTSPGPNYVSSDRPLPLVFQDLWNETQEPSEVDLLERSPTELSRLVCSYLPHGWGLVTCSISTAIRTILQGNFQGSEITVIDDSTERTSFLYNELMNNFQGQLLINETIGGSNRVRAFVPETEEAHGGMTEEDSDGDMRDSQVQSPPTFPIGNLRLPRSSGSEDTRTDSQSTDEESSTDEDENEVHQSPTIPKVSSTQPMVEGALGETSGTPIVEMTDINTEGASFVAMAREESTFRSQGVEMEGETSDSLAFAVHQRTPQSLVLSQSMSGSEPHEKVVCTRIDTGHVFSFVQGSNLPEDVIAFQGAFSIDREMLLNTEDGFYYNKDGVRHTRHGISGSYSYVEAASIGVGDAEVRPVQDQELSAMVGNAIEHIYGGASLENNESSTAIM